VLVRLGTVDGTGKVNAWFGALLKSEIALRSQHCGGFEAQFGAFFVSRSGAWADA
jgi:hypothetical protein